MNMSGLSFSLEVCDANTRDDAQEENTDIEVGKTYPRIIELVGLLVAEV